MFKKNIIGKRIYKVLKTAIEEREAVYADGVKELERELEVKKEELADSLVKSVVGKFL